MIRPFLAALAALALCTTAASAQVVDAARFVDPVSAWSASISPDGNFIAYIQRTAADQRVIVVDLTARHGTPVQHIASADGSLDWVAWKGSDRIILGATFFQHVGRRTQSGSHMSEAGHDVNVHRVIVMNRDGSNPVQMFEPQLRQLGSFGSALLVDDLPNDPTHVMIEAWNGNGVGAWLTDITSGQVVRVAEGNNQTWDYFTDGNGATVMRQDALIDGSGYRFYRRAPGSGPWTFVMEARRAETATNSPDFRIVGPGPGAGQVYVLARADNADLASLYLYDTATGALGEPVQASTASDGRFPWFARRTHAVVATCEFAQRLACHANDPNIQRHMAAIDAFFEHDASVSLVNMSDDGNKWLLFADGPTEAGGYCLYDVAAHRVITVAALYPNLDVNSLSPTTVENYQSRDGAALWAYVTARPGVTGPRPMVVFPHGGPEARDYYGYDSFAAFLASRGYVVLQPNFRGGSGLGRAFADAGRGQWGLRMQDDITDAVRHMIQTGVADPQRICIVGGSYGGYAALQGAASTPELYKCAISIAGVSDLREMLRAEGENGHGQMNYQYWIRSIGDPNVNGDAIDAASPSRHADRMTPPVLLIHGEDDDIVPIRQSEIMQRALNSAGHQTQLIRIPDEGHIWDAWSNEHRLQLYHQTEQFLRST